LDGCQSLVERDFPSHEDANYDFWEEVELPTFGLRVYELPMGVDGKVQRRSLGMEGPR